MLANFQVSTISQLQQEVQTFSRCFMNKETEQNWGERDSAIQRFRGVVRGMDELLKINCGISECIKPIMEPIVQTV